MLRKAKFLVLSGVGINCEKESAQALRNEDMDAHIVHLNDLKKDPALLRSYQGFYLPGGFSFGDELGSGRAISLILEQSLGDELHRFIENKRPILGVCNGFQMLVQLKLLPILGKHCLSLIDNKNKFFINTWVKLKVTRSDGPWFNQCAQKIMTLPIRHKEGQVIVEKTFSNHDLREYTALEYTEDINGAYQNIAALTDQTGLILGMMPHPEAAVDKRTSPLGGHQKASCDGKLIFKSIANYLRQS